MPTLLTRAFKTMCVRNNCVFNGVVFLSTSRGVYLEHTDFEGRAKWVSKLNQLYLPLEAFLSGCGNCGDSCDAGL